VAHSRKSDFGQWSIPFSVPRGSRYAGSPSGRVASSSLTRAASRSLVACFRRDSARRSYRSKARAISIRIAACLSGPSRFESRSLSSSSGICSLLAHFRAIRRATATFLFQFARVSYFGSARARETRSWRRDHTRRTCMLASARRRACSSISQGASARRFGAQVLQLPLPSPDRDGRAR
jgi:hypothetical protein